MDWGTILQNVTGAAGGTALVLFLARYLGDRSLQRFTQRHTTEQAEMQRTFSIGATSHMAEVAFDKHILFSEQYCETVSKILPAQIQGDEAEGEVLLAELSRIRQRWALWLTDDMEAKLGQYERGVARIPFEAPVLDADGFPAPLEASVRWAIGELRKLLAIEELTALRRELVLRSLKSPPKIV
jgi:hypothetical protein